MSDVGKKEDTRFDELQKAKRQQDGTDTPGIYDWLGEKVWSRDQLQAQNEKWKEKRQDEELRQKWYEQAQNALRIARAHTHEEDASRPDWYPPRDQMAWWVPDKVEVPSSWVATVAESNNTTTA